MRRREQARIARRTTTASPASRVAVALGLLLASCDSDSGRLVVDLRTDVRPGAEFSWVVTSVAREGATPSVEAPLLVDHRADPAREALRVAEFDRLAPGDYALNVRLLDSEMREVVSRPVRLQLRASTIATIVITRDCRSVRCPMAADLDATACLGGRCVDPRCTVENPDACGPAECRSDAECEGVAACGSACVAGVCLEAPPDRCGPDDAGLDAAAPPDAGDLDPEMLFRVCVEGAVSSPSAATWTLERVQSEAVSGQGELGYELRCQGTRCPSTSPRALTFDGDDYLETASHSATQLAGGYTLSTWVWLDAIPAMDADVVTRPWNMAVDNSIELLIRGRNYQFWSTDGTATTILDATGSVVTGRWQHVAVTRDGTSAALYVDGVRLDRASVTTPAAFALDRLLVGADRNGSQIQHFLIGSVQRLAIFDRALTAPQIVALNTACGPQ